MPGGSEVVAEIHPGRCYMVVAVIETDVVLLVEGRLGWCKARNLTEARET